MSGKGFEHVAPFRSSRLCELPEHSERGAHSHSSAPSGPSARKTGNASAALRENLRPLGGKTRLSPPTTLNFKLPSHS